MMKMETDSLFVSFAAADNQRNEPALAGFFKTRSSFIKEDKYDMLLLSRQTNCRIAKKRATVWLPAYSSWQGHGKHLAD